MRKRLFTALLVLAILLPAAFALWEGIHWPQAGGTAMTDKALTVDTTHISDGYVMVRGEPSEKKYKMRLSQGKATLNYDIPTDGSYEIIPLQMGSGKYKISLYRNAKGSKYSAEGEVSFSADLAREDAAFLVPNQYVSYNQNSQAVKLSETLCAGKTNASELLQAVRDYIRTNCVYDYVKAKKISGAVLPDIDYVLNGSPQMGICQDLSALAACMLRVQGVPTQLVIGYYGKQYHAWCKVRVDGEWVLYDPTADITGQESNPKKYSTERFY